MMMNTNPPIKELVPVTARGEATRRKLLASAEIEFGSKGFPAASVSSITQRADVGQGTFYLYFHSKEEVFATLVRQIGTEQCQQIAASTGSGAEAEQTVVGLLLEFVASQPGRFRILSESQFVDEQAYREMQEKLISAVAAHVTGNRDGINAESRLRAAALVGAAAQAALQHCQWGGKPVGKALVEAVTGAF